MRQARQRWLFTGNLSAMLFYELILLVNDSNINKLQNIEGAQTEKIVERDLNIFFAFKNWSPYFVQQFYLFLVVFFCGFLYFQFFETFFLGFFISVC